MTMHIVVVYVQGVPQIELSSRRRLQTEIALVAVDLIRYPSFRIKTYCVTGNVSQP